MKGWKYEGYRHSLAARGVKTRFSFRSHHHLTERPDYYTRLTAMEKGKCFAAKRNYSEFANDKRQLVYYPDFVKWMGISLFGVADDVALIDKSCLRMG